MKVIKGIIVKIGKKDLTIRIVAKKSVNCKCFMTYLSDTPKDLTKTCNECKKYLLKVPISNINDYTNGIYDMFSLVRMNYHMKNDSIIIKTFNKINTTIQTGNIVLNKKYNYYLFDSKWPIINIDPNDHKKFWGIDLNNNLGKKIKINYIDLSNYDNCDSIFVQKIFSDEIISFDDSINSEISENVSESDNSDLISNDSKSNDSKSNDSKSNDFNDSKSESECSINHISTTTPMTTLPTTTNNCNTTTNDCKSEHKSCSESDKESKSSDTDTDDECECKCENNNCGCDNRIKFHINECKQFVISIIKYIRVFLFIRLVYLVMKFGLMVVLNFFFKC